MYPYRQAFHRPRAYCGGAFYKPHTAGDWIYLGGILAPLAAGMLIKEPADRWKAVKTISILESAAFLSAKLWRYEIAPREHGQGRER